ncbi:MAG: M15 family metallopeptidase [Bacillota bacterium]
MRVPSPVLIGAAIVLGCAAAGFGGYEYLSVSRDLATTSAQRATLADQLNEARERNLELSDKLAAELAKNGAFESQIHDIASTVGTLTKLSQTDKELLQKYSRVYFLNENYTPSDLSEIDSQYQLNPAKHEQIHTKVKPYLERMLKDAAADGVPMLVLSSYRSFGQQAALKNSYLVTYGSGSNRFSADQGYSEHQLGTAVDLTTKELGTTSLAFGTSAAGKWLNENAYKYGFILSYPKGNAYYQYEPWHWRFVGTALSTRLQEDGEHFYDLSQRDIDQYLVYIFN